MTGYLININKEDLEQLGGLLFEAYLFVKKELLEAVKKINKKIDKEMEYFIR